MRSNRILTSIVFLVGCATGGVASQVVAPAASAQDGSKPMWEYRCDSLGMSSAPGKATVLNKAGVEGWELVGFHNNDACFKRTLP